MILTIRSDRMSSILDTFLDFLDFLDSIVKWLCIALIATMTSVVLLQVFARYLPFPTPSWTEELSRYLMISFAFIGTSSGIKRWNNVGVDFFIQKLPVKAQKVITVAIKISVLFLVVWIGYLGYKIFPVVGSQQHSATLKIPMVIPQMSIVVGCSLMTIQLIGVLIREFYTKGGSKNA
jgi:TRAP-type C4-dicarboxylate transport system permease small subunit